MAANAATHDPSERHVHIIPIPLLARTFIILLAFMALTIFAANTAKTMPFFHSTIGTWATNGIAIAIATVKALLVINIFMGVKFSSAITKIYVAIGFFGFSLMFIMFCDYYTRSWEPVASWNGTHDSATPRDRMKPMPELPEAGKAPAGH